MLTDYRKIKTIVEFKDSRVDLVLYNEKAKPINWRYGLAYIINGRRSFITATKSIPDLYFLKRKLQHHMWIDKIFEDFPGNDMFCDKFKQRRMYTYDEAYNIFN